ncbi:MAG: hypothetical protein ACRCT1_00940 [Microcoleaceae cyanobacterium]
MVLITSSLFPLPSSFFLLPSSFFLLPSSFFLLLPIPYYLRVKSDIFWGLKPIII